jgi:hypothetical protein
MSSSGLELDVEEVSDDDGNAAVGIKLRHPNYAVNLVVAYEDVELLTSLPDREPEALRIGSVAGVAAFWSIDSGDVAIMIGTDAEAWDFGVWITDGELQDIVDAAEGLAADFA